MVLLGLECFVLRRVGPQPIIPRWKHNQPFIVCEYATLQALEVRLKFEFSWSPIWALLAFQEHRKPIDSHGVIRVWMSCSLSWAPTNHPEVKTQIKHVLIYEYWTKWFDFRVGIKKMNLIYINPTKMHHSQTYQWACFDWIKCWRRCTNSNLHDLTWA
jgi:hypothetical protein